LLLDAGPPGAGASDAIFGLCPQAAFQIADALPDGLVIHARDRCNEADPPMSQALGFQPRDPATLAFIQIGK
jgi:hypothetical protein